MSFATLSDNVERNACGSYSLGLGYRVQIPPLAGAALTALSISHDFPAPRGPEIPKQPPPELRKDRSLCHESHSTKSSGPNARKTLLAAGSVPRGLGGFPPALPL